jgi:hypothetical protein
MVDAFHCTEYFTTFDGSTLINSVCRFYWFYPLNLEPGIENLSRDKRIAEDNADRPDITRSEEIGRYNHVVETYDTNSILA